MKTTFINLPNESLPKDIGQELLIVNNIVQGDLFSSPIHFFGKDEILVKL